MQAETQTAAAPDPDLLRTDDSDPDTNLHSALISEVATRISAVEDKFHVALTGMENKSDLTRLVLEGQLSSIEERAVKLYDIEKMAVKLDDIEEKMTMLDNIEAKMAKLDDIEERTAKLNDIEERMGKLHDIEERVVNLDDKIAELKDILGDLIERVRLVSSGSLTGCRSKN